MLHQFNNVGRSKTMQGNKYSKRIILIPILPLVFSLLFCCISESVSAAAVGVSPSILTITDVLRGNVYVREILIFSTFENATNFSLSANSEISDWVTFYASDDLETPIDSITIQPQSEAVIHARFEIPDVAANRTYTGTLDGVTDPLGEEITGQVGQVVRLKVTVLTNISVTGTQILRGTVDRAIVENIEIGLPLPIQMTFINTGNVQAQPTIEVEITKDGEHVASINHNETIIEVDASKVINLQWDPTGNDIGSYSAHISVFLGGVQIAEKDLPFRILPRGSLSAYGSFISLEYNGTPTVNKVIKILATFRNGGPIEIKAKLVCEVHHNGELVDVLENEAYVPTGVTTVITSFLKPNRAGDWLLQGYIIYEGKMTELKEMHISVSGGQQLLAPWLFTVIGVVLLAAIGGGFYILRRRRADNLDSRQSKPDKTQGPGGTAAVNTRSTKVVSKKSASAVAEKQTRANERRVTDITANKLAGENGKKSTKVVNKQVKENSKKTANTVKNRRNKVTTRQSVRKTGSQLVTMVTSLSETPFYQVLRRISALLGATSLTTTYPMQILGVGKLWNKSGRGNARSAESNKATNNKV